MWFLVAFLVAMPFIIYWLYTNVDNHHGPKGGGPSCFA